jgi:hypothetical protein
LNCLYFFRDTLYSILVVIVIVIVIVMVAQTRSSIVKNNIVAVVSDDDASHHRSRRRVKITTPSLREASIRTYKVYTPRTATANTRRKTAAVVAVEEEEFAEAITDQEHDDDDMSYIADAMMELEGRETRKNTVITKHMCINPMTPITRYAYGVHVYNSAKTLHYRSAYILYDNITRLYTVYSIISNVIPGHDGGSSSSYGAYATENDEDDDTVHILPHPVHTVHAKYTTFISDAVVNYIMTLIVPSGNYDYFIQDDILGVVASNAELSETAFGPDSSYYDIAQLFQEDHSSRETTNGLKAFHLIPSREFWFDPAGGAYRWLSFSDAIVKCALMIVSQSQ